MTTQDDKVRWPSIKKYPCKRNKGQHEYINPTLVYEPDITYIYKTDGGELHSSELHKELKYIKTKFSVFYEIRCKHCGKKQVFYLSDNIK